MYHQSRHVLLVTDQPWQRAGVTGVTSRADTHEAFATCWLLFLCLVLADTFQAVSSFRLSTSSEVGAVITPSYIWGNWGLERLTSPSGFLVKEHGLRIVDLKSKVLPLFSQVLFTFELLTRSFLIHLCTNNCSEHDWRFLHFTCIRFSILKYYKVTFILDCHLRIPSIIPTDPIYTRCETTSKRPARADVPIKLDKH